MTEQLCPMKFSKDESGNKITWKCENKDCAWWSTYHNCCAIQALAMSCQGVKESLDQLKDV